MKERRTKEKIICQILETCLKGINITAVANKVALNNQVTNSYLKMLIRKGMIQEKDGLYITTTEGARILPVLKNIQDAFSDSQ